MFWGALTWCQRWEEWCGANSLAPLEGDIGDWVHFVECRRDAAITARTTWCQADWLRVQLLAPIPADEIPRSPKRTPNAKTELLLPGKDTPVADPALLLHLGAMEQDMYKGDDANLGCGLAALVSHMGVLDMHIRHVQDFVHRNDTSPWFERLPLGDRKAGKPVSVGHAETLMPIRYSSTNSQSEKYVTLLHVKILAKPVRVLNSPVVWEDCRGVIAGTHIGHLRVLVAEGLDKEHATGMVYRNIGLPASLHGVGKVKVLLRRRKLPRLW